LFVGRDVHSEPVLSGGAKGLARRCIPDLSLEAGSLALQIGSLGVKLRQSLGLADANRSAPHDGQRDEDEGGEHDPDQGPAPHGYAALCHARSLALRERGLMAVSRGLAVTARLVSNSPSAFPRQVH